MKLFAVTANFAILAAIVPFTLCQLQPDGNYQYCGAPVPCSVISLCGSEPWKKCENGTCVCREDNSFADCEASPPRGACVPYPSIIDTSAKCGLDKHCVDTTGEGIEEHAWCYIINITLDKYGTCMCKEGISLKVEKDKKCWPIITGEGQKCEHHGQCNVTGENQVCTQDSNAGEKRCKCSREFVDEAVDSDELSCVKITDEITPCDNNEQCEGPDQMCLHDPGETGFCKCTNGYVDVHDKNETLRCLREIENETEVCESDLQCNGEHQVCTEVRLTDPQKYCRCHEEYVDHDPSDNLLCAKITDETTNCTNDKQCDGEGVECGREDEDGNTYCRCKPDFVDITPDDTSKLVCLEKILADDKPCDDTLQCDGPNQICSLKPEEQEDELKYCGCETNFVDVHDKNNSLYCLPEITNEKEECLYDQQCTDAYAICKDEGGKSYCKCHPDFVDLEPANEDLLVCGKITDEITPCDNDQQCGDPNTYCFTNGEEEKGICQCEDGFVDLGEAESLSCFKKISNEVDPCDDTKQCADVGAICDGTCKCPPDYMDPIEGEEILCLLENVPIKENCTYYSQCRHLNYADCLEGICECIRIQENESFYDDGEGKCYKYMEHNERCDLPKQCQFVDSNSHPDGASLVNCSPPEGSNGDSVCTCVENGFPFTAPDSLITQCWFNVTTDDVECFHNEQCQANNINTECALVEEGKSRCQCKSDHVDVDWSPELNCFKVVYEEGAQCYGYNEVCHKGMGNNAECNADTGYCQCKAPFRYYNAREGEKCFVPKELGQPCASNWECAVVAGWLAECGEEERCRCAQGAVTAEAKCWERKIVGSGCNSTKECEVIIDGNVWCDFIGGDGVCRCSSGSKEDMGGTTCSNGFKVAVDMNVVWVLLVGILKFWGN